MKNALPKGTQVQHYVIERTIGGGGFSIVYLAKDLETDEVVAIKEYLPEKQALRTKDHAVQCISEDNIAHFKQGFKRFFDEAAALAKLSHPNIVHVTNFFRANNTVYMVMDYEKGKDLRFYIKRHGGSLSEKFIRTVFSELLNGLSELHKNNLLHLDIKPANIFLRLGGSPFLLDFGAVREAVIGDKPAGPHTLTRGFAPIEQHEHKRVGPWTDIYAFGASMYACMCGKAPPAATDRIIKDTYRPATLGYFGRPYSAQLLEAVDWCLQLNQNDRPQSVEELVDFLNEDSELAKTFNEPWYLKQISLPWGKNK
jgi:serine/threonine protein kinase